MTNVALDPQLDSIFDRRKQLRYQRRLKFLQAGWRTLAISGLAGGLIWAAYLPEWVIGHPKQVSIKGNQLLSTQTIQALLPLPYPQNLVRLQPAVIAEALESRAPIDKATVTRQLFPPSLTIAIQERHPVAVIPCVGNQHCPATSPTTALPAYSGSDIWLLDSHGIIMPSTSYPSLQDSAKRPKLTVLGMMTNAGSYRPEVNHQRPAQGKSTSQISSLQLEQASAKVDKRKKSQWPQLYQVVSQSPVKVFEIDWRNETNLIFKTELGTIHLGHYSSKLANQLNSLDQMRKLPKYLNSDRVKYINLENPDRPVLQLENTAKPNLKSAESPS